MTKDEIAKSRHGIEWKANLYALAAELLQEAEDGDPLALRIVARVGLVEPLRLVSQAPAGGTVYASMYANQENNLKEPENTE